MSTPAWLARFRVTQTWEAHRKNGSEGGVDWATPVGTIIKAPSSGRLTFYTYRDGSSCLRVQRADGSATEFLHGHVHGVVPRDVQPGDDIGESDGRRGTPGAGPSTGAHLHGHDIDVHGRRVPPFTTTTGAAGGDTTPLDDAQEDDDMATNSGFWYRRASDSAQINIIVNTASGLFHAFQSSDGSYNTAIAKAFGVSETFAQISESHAAKLEADCAAVRPTSAALGRLEFTGTASPA